MLFPPVQDEDGILQTLATSRKHNNPKDRDKKVRDEAWRVMVLVWQAVCAALIPIKLRQIPEALDLYLEHLGRSNKHSRGRQIPIFVEQLGVANEFG